MVSVSAETAEQTRVRLRDVIARADLEVLDGVWTFQESPLHVPPELTPEVLAVVRDAEKWSALRPASSGEADTELFGLFSFHFPAGLDNSGFVGWLATELKQRLGTGVFVVCGSNTERGGIYDYWGCPVDMIDKVRRVLEALRAADAA